jgi:hypothetical protein
MDIYPTKKRKGMIHRIKTKEVVASVLSMTDRVKRNGFSVVFFPEAGGLPLQYIFKHIATEQSCGNIKIFSSKITAAIKIPLRKQICSILSSAERNRHLTSGQISDFKIAITKLSQSSRNAVEQNVDIKHLAKLRICDLINAISEIGLHVPSEDKANWIKAGIINSHSYSPENFSLKDFFDFRKKTIAYSLDYISDIVHETRPLLNIILAQTDFATAIHQNTVYVIDEAISRGRTLNAIEIIFKAFDKDVKWKIGVLFCPLKTVGRGNVDFIFSNNRIPPLSNRFDLIGSIIVESDVAFARYDIDELFLKAKKVNNQPNKKKITEYFKRIRFYARKRFSLFLRPGLIYEDDLIRLLHFIFVCDEEAVIKRCLDLNPVKIWGIIEEVSFYINMPHPFDSMPTRKEYKDGMFEFLKYIENILAKNPAGKELINFKKEFLSLKRDYETLELQCWSRRHHKMLFEIDKALIRK